MDQYVALIPVRGGSKSIPLKNIKLLCGRPLVYWTMDAALHCPELDRVYVCTDSPQIRSVVESYITENQCGGKISCIGRPEEAATDTASTESVMQYFADTYPDFKYMVLIQATSPTLQAHHLSEAIRLFEERGYDSMLSGVRQKRFCWAEKDGYFYPTNYDYRNRPRRQEFNGYLVENGAFYIHKKELFDVSQYRLYGKIGLYEMPEESYLEIDEPSDWVMIENILQQRKLKK